MLNQSRFYRKFKCTRDWKHPDTFQIMSTPLVIDLGDVSSYEKYVGDAFGDTIDRTVLQYNVNKPDVIIRMKFEDFDEVFNKFHNDQGSLDDRSIKKKYKGPIKMYFTGDKWTIVQNTMPDKYDFTNKTPENVQSDMIWYNIIPLN